MSLRGKVAGIVAASVISMLAAEGVWCQNGAVRVKDDYSVRIHQEFSSGVRLNPRLESMGGAYVAHSSWGDALTGNPAGLSVIDAVVFDLFGGLYQLSGDLTYGGLVPRGDAQGDFGLFSFGVGFPVNEYLVMGFGMQHVHAFDESDDLMDWDHNATLFHLTLAGALSETVTIGYRLGYQFADREGDGYLRKADIDWDNGLFNTLGLQWQAHDDVRLGLALDYKMADIDVASSLFTPIPGGMLHYQVKRSGDAREVGIRGGVSWDMTPETLLAFDLSHARSKWDYDSYRDPEGARMSGGREKRDETTAALGVEHAVNEWLVLRGGFKYVWVDYDNTFSSVPYDADLDYPVFSTGCGMYFGDIRLDWLLSYTPEGDGDWTSMIGLQFKL